MTAWMMRGACHGLVLLAAGAIASGAAAEQSARRPSGAFVQPLGDDAGADLRQHLRTLARNPRSLEALIGAGRAAIRAGDAQAALSFFGRADQVSPRNARVRAGMGSALAHMAQARTALTLFAEAVALGAPVAEIAGDRGLAYDLLGDPRRAQQDYTVALRFRADPEVQRRLALSLAISGERDAALRLIDPLLRRHDRAAWRVQAFVLALTGDAAGAARTVGSLMPPASARAMTPFLTRLPSLSAAEKALAVHFGHFPSDALGRQSASPNAIPADPDAVALAMGGPPRGVQTRPDRSTRSSAGSRQSAEARSPRTVRDRRSSRATRSLPAASPSSEDPDPEPGPAAQPNIRWAGAPAESLNPPPPAPRPAQEPPPAEPVQTPFSLSQLGLEPAPSSRSRPGLADIAEVVQALPEDSAAEPAAIANPRASDPDRQSSNRPAQPAHPSRHWVQIAGGADRSALPREFARLRGLAPAELDGRTPWTTPLRATNRLLVGPFATVGEAQAFVNQLGRRNLAAFAWTSPAGQEIVRLQPR